VKRYQVGIKAACSLLFLAFLGWYAGQQDLASVMRRADPIYLALCVLLSPVLVAASTWKWRAVLKQEGYPTRFGALFASYLVGYFFSNFLPSNVGGDVARSYRVGRSVGDQAAAAASIVVERVTGLLGLLVLAVTMPWLRSDLALHPALLLPSSAALAGLLILLVAGFFPWRGSAPSASVPGWWGRMRAHLLRFAARSGQALATVRSDSGYLFRLLALTALFYGLAMLNIWLAFRAFGATPALTDLAAVLPAALLVAMIPVSLGSLGLAEGAYVFYFGLVGMDPALTLVMSLLLRAKILLLGSAGGIVYWSREKEPTAIAP
jgi:uncharacterized protein (TIRG00374 family)